MGTNDADTSALNVDANVNIDDIINNNDKQEEQPQQEEEEKHETLQADFASTTAPKELSTTNVTADFPEDSTALDLKSKIESRQNRFGPLPPSDAEKIESRKRRFASMNASNAATDQPIKKQKVDPAKERQKIFERAQKFGTALPKDFELTTEQSALLYADKIERAKRFHTEHLLPAPIKKAEFGAKKAERMKRFKNENGDANAAQGEEEEATSKKDIIPSEKNNDDGIALMERKLRFGTTLNEMDKEQKFATRGGKFKGKKGFNKNQKKRQFKNKQKFRSYREYNKFTRKRPWTRSWPWKRKGWKEI